MRYGGIFLKNGRRGVRPFANATPPQGARAPSKPTGGVTGPRRSTRPGTSWLMAGLGRSMLTGPDSPVTEFIPALRTV